MIKVDSQQLYAALSSISKVSLSANNSPVYKCVMIIVTEKMLVCRGTDLITFVERRVELANSDSEKGSFLVVLEPLLNYLRESDGVVSLTFNKADVVVRSSVDQASLKLRSVEDFATWPKWSSLTELDCDAVRLSDAIKSSLSFVATSLISPIFYNISIRSNSDNKLVVQSSDGFSFIITTVGDVKKGAFLSCLIPFNAALKIQDVQSPTSVGLSDNILGFRLTDGAYYFRLSSGAETYPELSKSIPSKFSLVLKIDKKAIMGSLSRAVGFSDAQYRKTKLVCDTSGIKITATSEDFGTYSGSIKSVKGKGNPIELFVDTKYLSEFLKFVDKQLIIAFTTDKGAIVLNDPDNKELVYVMFPLVSSENK